MKKMDPRKQLLEATAAREADQQVLRRHYRGELAKVAKLPWTWRNPYSSVTKVEHLKDRDGQPFYLGDRVVMVGSNSTFDGMTGTVIQREDVPDDSADNGYNIPVEWDNPPGEQPKRVWCGTQFLLHELVFTSVDDIEEYLDENT